MTTRILALETSGTAGSVAALDEGQIRAEIPLKSGQRSAQSLAPAMQEILRQVGWQSRDVQLVAITVGPGSFTGLRVGVTTAKAFVYATGAEVIGVNTLDCLARQAPVEAARVAVAIDAYRGQVFARHYERAALGVLVPIDGAAIVDNDAWLASLLPGSWVSGPGLFKLASHVPAGVNVVTADLWQPRASVVGQVGWDRFAAGERDDLWRLMPLYLRRSAAEEKWQASHGQD